MAEPTFAERLLELARRDALAFRNIDHEGLQ